MTLSPGGQAGPVRVIEKQSTDLGYVTGLARLGSQGYVIGLQPRLSMPMPSPLGVFSHGIDPTTAHAEIVEVPAAGALQTIDLGAGTQAPTLAAASGPYLVSYAALGPTARSQTVTIRVGQLG